MVPTRTDAPNAECPHCGERFTKLKEGMIPTHDFPKPCRMVCRGSGKPPRRKDAPLYKDDPTQEERDCYAQGRQELLIYGFALVKFIGEMRGHPNGEMPCPLCQKPLKYRIAKGNGHCAAKCSTPECLNMIE
jgi:ribosomal protein L37AE/L43A